MEMCNIVENDDLDLNTPIYKYLSMEAFFFLLNYRRMMFSRLSTWPDAFEGAIFEFFKQIENDDNASSKIKNHFLGCSWTLQTEDSCFYNDADEHEKAEEELRKSGSASMWEGYCKNGGVRIKTTIGKVKAILAGC